MDSGDIEKVKAIIEKKTGEECGWEQAEECADTLNFIADMIAEIIIKEIDSIPKEN